MKKHKNTVITDVVQCDREKQHDELKAFITDSLKGTNTKLIKLECKTIIKKEGNQNE